DEMTLDAMEIAVDLATLDPATDIAILRGGVLDHPKYRGRRVFGSGINLTHLYRGKIPFVWFLQRELGFVHKLLRGIARPEASPAKPSNTSASSSATARKAVSSATRSPQQTTWIAPSRGWSMA